MIYYTVIRKILISNKCFHALLILCLMLMSSDVIWGQFTHYVLEPT